MKTLLTSLACSIIFLLTSCMNQQKTASTQSPLADKAKRFVPTEITADVSKLSYGDRQALDKLIEAAKLMDSLYLIQKWSGSMDLLAKLRADNTPEGKAKLNYFIVNMGPWSKLDHDEPFIDGVSEHPEGANYYPANMSKDEFVKWDSTLSDDKKKEAEGFFYTIRRDGDGKLMTVPYSTEYKTHLEPAAKLLHEAAALTDNKTLKDFLNKRADAFLSNDYYESDVAWMDLDSPIEPTIGPYEVYMDEIFNYKAAFEAFITIRDDEETGKLAKFASYLQEIENNLPIEKKYRNPKLGALAPIRVVDEVVVGGESHGGVQTAAFNLPNDERVTREKGSKRVMLKNVQEAKFNKILIPITNIAVDQSQRSLVSFEPFFTHILAHELMHGLGPHTIMVNGKQSTVRQEMKELSSAFEEAKADISGLFCLQYLIDKGVIEKTFEQQLYATYLAGTFRSVRFGTNDAHGKGMAMQFNYLTDEGAFEYNGETGTYKVNFDKVKDGMKKLVGDIMTAQAEGNYAKAKEMLDKYGVIRPEMQKVMDKLNDLPTDIAPMFPLAEGK